MVSRIGFLIVATAACTGPRGANSGGATKLPPRPPTCDLAIHHTPTSGVQAWDDLGVAEVTCHINVGLPQCMRQFRAEACRMGADIVYAFPKEPLRPREQAIVYRGRVAHTRPAPPPVTPSTPVLTPTPARRDPPPPPPPADGGVESATNQ